MIPLLTGRETYTDFHSNDEQGSGPVLDFHRFVPLFNHSFTSRLRLVGELEVEHALSPDERSRVLASLRSL